MNRRSILIKDLSICFFFFILWGCENSSNGPFQEGLLEDFLFQAKNNSSLQEDIRLQRNGDTLFAQVPAGTSVQDLVASWITPAPLTQVFIETGTQEKGRLIPQESQISTNDFSRPITYLFVSSRQDTLRYVVDVTYFTGLPILHLNTLDAAEITSKQDYLSATLEVEGGRYFQNVKAEVKIRGRGNSTWGLPKKPYQIKFDKKRQLLGMPSDKRWVLLANYYDHSMLRNQLGFELSRQSGLDWTPQSQFCEVFINQVYQGTYQATQKVEESSKRVAVSNDGYLLEIEPSREVDRDHLNFKTPRMTVMIKDPDDLEKNGERFFLIKDYFEQVESILYQENSPDRFEQLKAYLDLESFVDWYLINEIAKNSDAGILNSFFLNMRPNGKLKAGPVWDSDIAFGNFLHGIDNNHTGWIISTEHWLEQLLQDPDFRKMVKSRFEFFYQKRGELPPLIDRYAYALRYAQEENDRLWQTIGKPSPHRNAIPLLSYEAEIAYLKSWITQRYEWLNGEFETW